MNVVWVFFGAMVVGQMPPSAPQTGASYPQGNGRLTDSTNTQGTNSGVGSAANPSTAADTGAKASSSVKIESVWDFIVKGGPVMIPIGLCSFAALAIAVERFTSLRRRTVIPHDFLPGLHAILSATDASARRSLDYCKAKSGPLANIFAAGIRRLGQPPEVVERAIEEAGRREIAGLRKHLRALSVIGSVSPLLGLLGTIFGMISAFQTVASSAEALGRTELLAGGIYEAMITTAAGLCVAIPVVLLHHALVAKVERLVREMDLITMEFVENFARPAERKPLIPSAAYAESASAVAAEDGRMRAMEPAAA